MTTREKLQELLTLHQISPCETLLDSIEQLYSKEDTVSLEERKQAFVESVRPYIEVYGKDMCNQFSKWWLQKNPKGRKFKFEFEKTWDLKLRLSTWYKRSQTYSIVGMLNKGKKWA